MELREDVAGREERQRPATWRWCGARLYLFGPLMLSTVYHQEPCYGPLEKSISKPLIYSAFSSMWPVACSYNSAILAIHLSVALLSFTVITHRVANAHCGLGASETFTNNFLGWRSAVFEVGNGGLLVTFEQPFHVPRAEQAQGVLPRLNPQLKKAQPAISSPAISKTDAGIAS